MSPDRWKLPAHRSVHLARIDAGDTSSFDGSKEAAESRLARLREQLDRLQEQLYADHRHALLIVLQGMDTAGKDGVIRHVFEGVNPQGVEVASFKAPTPVELDHDFLWRVHPHAPAKGHIAIFNRSHYEDVLAARVHRLVPESVWVRRYREINEFERELANEGVVLVKFFLHIDRDAQRARLLERVDDPTKRWKLTEADLRERRFWRKYQRAYEEVLSRTNTAWAPWHVIPSNHKWLRNYAVSKVLVETLDSLGLAYPEGSVDPAEVRRALSR